ncbi:MAG: hypothetical protein IJP64_02820 [Oscillospiraceae bacterium]|nr:hypothetical protein [Oscillospiraceae bacterium]
MEKKEKQPRGFYVEKGSFFAHVSVTLLVLSIAARFLGTMNLWGDMTQLMIQTLLPVGSALLFILFILLLGRIALWTTILPVLGGAAFFILSSFGKEPLTLFICIALAFLAVFLYTATLTGMIRTKWILVLVFMMIIAYQIIFRAIPVFGDMQNPVSFLDGMALLSTLGFVLAMLCAALALRRRKAVKAETELPKIKDPVVVPPSSEEAEQIASAPNGEETAAVDAPAAEESSVDLPADDALTGSAPELGAETAQGESIGE